MTPAVAEAAEIAALPAAQPKPHPLMELSVRRDELLAELAIAQAISSVKTTVPLLSHLLLEAESGKLRITATNLQEGLRTTVPARVRYDGTATVPARKFFDYVRLLPAGEISLKLLENQWVQIQSGRSRSKMMGMAAADFPRIPSSRGLAQVPLPAAALRVSLPRVHCAVSEEEQRHTLTGALLVITKDMLTLVGTDGHRLAKVDRTHSMPALAEDYCAIVPARALSTLQALLAATKEHTVGFSDAEGSLVFQLGEREFSSRKISGSFPNYKAVVPAGNTKVVMLPVAEMERSVRRVAQFADQRSRSVKLTLRANMLRISSNSAESGESEDLLEVPYAGEPVTIGFNSDYLLDFLKAIGDAKEFCLKLKDGSTAAALSPESRPANEDSYLYVLMPMRV